MTAVIATALIVAGLAAALVAGVFVRLAWTLLRLGPHGVLNAEADEDRT